MPDRDGTDGITTRLFWQQEAPVERVDGVDSDGQAFPSTQSATVRITKTGHGLEAAATESRSQRFREAKEKGA